jgi:hypothetical protein
MAMQQKVPTTTTTSTSTCTVCGTALERLRYFPRQLITADDMRAEQEYLLNKQRRHNRFLHGWGVVCGCNVIAQPDDQHPWQVQVCPGYVVAPQGDDILINDCVTFDLLLGATQCPPCSVTYPCPPQPVWPNQNEWQTAYLAVRYCECVTRPVRVHPSGCGCDEMDCEYSRMRESFELKLLWALPQSHTDANNADAQWANAIKNALSVIPDNVVFPAAACAPCSDDPWVVLASIRIPAVALTGKTAGTKTPITAANITFGDRRLLYSTSALQVIVEAVSSQWHF